VDPLPEFEDGDRVGWLIPVAPGTLGDGDMTFSSTNITLECPFFEEPVDMNGVTNLIAFCEDLTLVEIQELINSKISQDISIGTTSGGIDFDEKAIIGIFKAGPANDEGQIEYEFLQVWALDLSLDLEEG